MAPRLIEDSGRTDIPLNECEYPTGDMLTAGLFDPHYRLGRLQFFEPLVGHGLRDSLHISETTSGGWRVHQPVELVVHPDKGALLLNHCIIDCRRSLDSLYHQLEQTHCRLVDVQRKIRRRLDNNDFWHGRPIVLGIGIGVCCQLPHAALPPKVPPRLVVNCSVLDAIEARIEELYDFHTTPASTPASSYGQRLADDLTQSPQWIGAFTDRTESLRSHHAHDGRPPRSPQAA